MTDFVTSFNAWKLLELLAIVFGFIYVLLEVKKTRKMWYVMIVASVFNIAVFVHQQFWAMAILQVYYIVTAIYGIAKWTDVIDSAVKQYGEIDRKHRTEIAVVKMNPKKAVISSVITLVAMVVVYVLSARTYQPMPGDIPGKPFLDAATAGLSMLATYWLSQSYIEQWYIWIVVNVTGIVIFPFPLFNGHPENALVGMGLLYVAYLVTSIVGLVNWRKNKVMIKIDEDNS